MTHGMVNIFFRLKTRVVRTATTLRRKFLLFASNCTAASVLRRPVQRPQSLRRRPTVRPRPRVRPRQLSASCVAPSPATTPTSWDVTRSLASRRRGIPNSLRVTRPSRLPSNLITRTTKMAKTGLRKRHNFFGFRVIFSRLR